MGGPADQARGWRPTLALSAGVALLMAVFLAVLVQSTVPLALAVPALALGHPVVLLLDRLAPRTRQRTLAVVTVVSAVLMAIAWGVGGVAVAPQQATLLWVLAAPTGLAALLLLLADAPIARRVAVALAAGLGVWLLLSRAARRPAQAPAAPEPVPAT